MHRHIYIYIYIYIYILELMCVYIYIYIYSDMGGIMVIQVGNGKSKPSSKSCWGSIYSHPTNDRQDYLHFTLC